MRILKTILPLYLISASLFAMDRDQMTDALAQAAKLEGKPYLALRGRVLDQPDVKPLLLVAASDPKLTWRQRLVARIWHEKIVRGVDIAALRSLDWRKEPGYKKEWERYRSGPVGCIGKNLAPRVLTRKFHLWYYYIELNWKDTGEIATGPQASRFNRATGRYPGQKAWHSMCLRALDKTPERFYIFNIYRDLFDQKEWGRRQFQIYADLMRGKNPETIPILLKYFRKNYHELYEQQRPGECTAADKSLYEIFLKIASFATSCQLEAVKKFVDRENFIKTVRASLPLQWRERERQGKASLLYKDPELVFEKIRHRPASEPLTEPPYYLASGDKDSDEKP